MTKVVDIAEAQSHLKGLLAQARKGDAIIIQELGEDPVQLAANDGTERKGDAAWAS